MLHVRYILLSLLAVLSACAARAGVRVWNMTDVEGMPQTRTYAVIQSGDGYIWIATRDGLVRYDGTVAKVYKTRPSDRGSLPGNHFRHLFESPDGNICVKVDKKYYLFRRSDERFDTLSSGITPPDRQHIPDSVRARLSGLPQFRGKEIYVLFNDRQDGWWVESSEGLSRVLFTADRPTPIKYNADGEEPVRALMTDTDGRTWIADKNGYLRNTYGDETLWLGADGTLSGLRQPFGHNVYSLLHLGGDIWAGTKPDGLFLIRDGRVSGISGAGRGIYAMATDSEGRIFAASYDSGLSVIDHPRSPVPTARKTGNYPGIRTLYIDNKDRIFAGTDTGLFEIAFTDGEARTVRHLLPESVIMDICPDDDGGLLLATYGNGLVRLGPDGTTDYMTVEEGLGSDICLSVTRGTDGAYYVIGEHTISRHTGDGRPVRIYAQGYFGGEPAFSEGKPVFSPDGLITAGTSQGTLTFDPSETGGFVPPLVFSCPDTLRLGPDHRSLDVSFAVLDYNRTMPVRYAWRADRDSVWHRMDDGRLTFADIAPGTTRIAVCATDGSGEWSAGPRTLVIERRPRLTERPVFWLLTGILAAAVAYGAVRLVRYILRLKREVKSLTIEKGELAKYFNARLHDLMSPKPKVSDTRPAEKDLTERVNEYLEANYNNPDIGVNSLCAHLAMSHTRLYREIKEACGMTPANLIVGFRIRKAEEMLAGGEKNISEVAYACGWSDPKYFSKVFHKTNGSTPTEYLRSISEKK